MRLAGSGAERESQPALFTCSICIVIRAAYQADTIGLQNFPICGKNTVVNHGLLNLASKDAHFLPGNLAGSICLVYFPGVHVAAELRVSEPARLVDIDEAARSAVDEVHLQTVVILGAESEQQFAIFFVTDVDAVNNSAIVAFLI